MDFELPLDYFVIDRILNPLTQKIQKLVGLDCFFWARLALVLAIICEAVTLFFMSMILFQATFFSLLMAFSTIAMMTSHFHFLFCRIHGVESVRDFVYAELEKGRFNPLILNPRWYSRFVFNTMFQLIILFHDGLGMLVFIIIAFAPYQLEYVIQCLCACTPLPPQKSKLRKALDSLSAKFSEELSGEGGGLQPA